MIVLTNENHMITAVSKAVKKVDLGLQSEDDGIIHSYKVNLYELESVPEEITPYQWSYTEDEGFYLTPPPPGPDPEPKTEIEVLGEELIKIKFESMQKDLLLNSMGSQLTDIKLGNMQKDLMMNSLGQEVTKLKLEVMSLKGGE